MKDIFNVSKKKNTRKKKPLKFERIDLINFILTVARICGQPLHIPGGGQWSVVHGHIQTCVCL